MSESPSLLTANSLPRPLLRGWIHIAGALALPCCSPLLFARARTWSQVGWVLCFLVGVESMFVASALFHRIRWTTLRRRQLLKRADLSAIFFAMAGSYLAFAGLTMHGDVRLVPLLVVVGGVGLRVALRHFALHTPTWANTVVYLIFGWAALAVSPQIYRGGGRTCLVLIVAGGLAYTMGAFCYATKRPQLVPRVFGYHELFHVGTLLGAGLHFWALSVVLH